MPKYVPWKYANMRRSRRSSNDLGLLIWVAKVAVLGLILVTLFHLLQFLVMLAVGVGMIIVIVRFVILVVEKLGLRTSLMLVGALVGSFLLFIGIVSLIEVLRVDSSVVVPTLAPTARAVRLP